MLLNAGAVSEGDTLHLLCALHEVTDDDKGAAWQKMIPCVYHYRTELVAAAARLIEN